MTGLQNQFKEFIRERKIVKVEEGESAAKEISPPKAAKEAKFYLTNGVGILPQILCILHVHCYNANANHISKQQPSDAISVLAEGQSPQCYKRMRLSQPFETPQQKREWAQITPVQQPKHSPKFENVQWDTDKLLDRLHNWPSEQKINWTEIGREFNIPGKNKGQVVKEFAREHGVGVCQLDHRPHNKRLRARKLRMPGGDISVPHSLYCVPDWDAAFVLPAPLAFFLVCRLAESRGGGLQQRQFQTHFQLKIADSSETLVALFFYPCPLNDMIKEGELSLGEPCYSHTLVRYTVKEGKLERTETVVYGRKIPLLELRQKLLQKHEPFMHLHTDDEISKARTSTNAQTAKHTTTSRSLS